MSSFQDKQIEQIEQIQQIEQIEQVQNVEQNDNLKLEMPKNWYITSEFQLKLDSCLQKSENLWILSEIQRDTMLEEIAEIFMDFHEYDGDIMTDGTSALLEAFICYKKERKIPKSDAKYLRNRGGMIAHYWNNEEKKIVVLSAIELINCYEQNDNFVKWLNSI